MAADLRRSVFDASALLALVLKEPGGKLVESVLIGSLMSTVNLSEAIAKLIDRGGAEELIVSQLPRLNIALAPFDAEAAYEAGELRRKTQRKNISFGDRACLALGMRTRLPIYTGDREWTELGLPVDIRLIR